MRTLMRNLNEVLATPLWILMRLFVAVLPNHPWHKRKISLADWTRNRTQTMIELDLTFWLACFIVIPVLSRLELL